MHCDLGILGNHSCTDALTDFLSSTWKRVRRELAASETKKTRHEMMTQKHVRLLCTCCES